MLEVEDVLIEAGLVENLVRGIENGDVEEFLDVLMAQLSMIDKTDWDVPGNLEDIPSARGLALEMVPTSQL